MPETAVSFPALDRVIHEPARLAILTILSSCRRADFLFLQRASGLTKGNLSVQLSRLEESGLVDIEKTIVRKRTQTMVTLSAKGRKDLKRYWHTLDDIRSQKYL